MFRKSIVFLLVLAILICLPSVASAEESAPEKEGYVLDFSTEFNDGNLNTEYWLPQYLPHCTTNTVGSTARYKVENGYLNLYITKDSPDYFGGQPGSADHDNLLWIANGIQTWEKNHLHPGGAQQMEVEPYEGYATQYGYFEIRMKMPDTGGGGYASWWLIGAQDDANPDGTGSVQNGEIDVMETFFKSPGVFEPKVHGWDDPNLDEWASKVELDGDQMDYVNEFHTYAMDWRPEGITFYVDGKEVAQTRESPQYRMCMILSMYINSDFSGWDEPENKYPIEWLIDYVRVYKDKNGYNESNRLTKFERFVKELCDSFTSFWQRVLSFFQDIRPRCHQFFEFLLSKIPALYRTINSDLMN